MTDLKLKAPAHGLSLQFVTADSTHVDWGNLGERSRDGIGFRVILPRPTYAAIADHAADLLDQWREDDADSVPEDTGETITNDQLDDFQASDGYGDWEQSFEPMMNFAWPVSFAYGMQDQEAVASLMDMHAGNTTLIEFNDESNPFGDEFDSDAPEYAIALTGGGMDMSDHIAVAYLCCGCVPPERILSGLDGFTGPARSGSLAANADLLAEAYAKAVDFFRHRADRLGEVIVRLAMENAKESADA